MAPPIAPSVLLFLTFLALPCCTTTAKDASTASLHLPAESAVLKRRGTGWGFGELDEMAVVSSLGWWYNWGQSSKQDALDAARQWDMEFVAMQWGKWGVDRLVDVIPSDTNTLLGFNEPNHQRQANLLPAEAAALWPKVQEAAEKLGLRLGAPAAAPCGAQCITANPFEWWDQFFGNCTNCRFDFLATHYYNCNPAALKWYLDTAYVKYQLPIWLTEFDCPNGAGPMQRELLFLLNALQVLDSHPAVERYAWYAMHTAGGWIGPTASLVSPGNATLSPIGQWYLRYGVQGGDHDDVLLQLGLQHGDVAWQAGESSRDWQEHCAPCFTERLQGVLTGQRGGAPEDDALLTLCNDCGFHAEVAHFEGPQDPPVDTVQ